MSAGGSASARRWRGGWRWGTPDDAARLVGWLCSADGGWVTEGGFNRYG
ncbi:hypothetical protein AB0J74_00595 [Asanoa sp. NPDC049573]